ncbi:hypothetical protein [Altericroceibacterium endophyticum]|uniref:DUF115 domain-containing protein n=1 Tax=Altericroceibacterium endophyticum TaxID=1808508 RepID=A0A6I4TB25_9SPHN|nr:hypothetical protein [Altericroceibacterium endophyticum]MXO67070.1 hypothetical protein [Altericroceibacterium endophyticum]
MLKALIGLTKPVRYRIEGILYKLSSNRESLEQLKDRYRGKPMLIVGNGPSLNKTPLDQFLDVPSIGMNKIDLLFDRTRWRPSMILCTNNVVVKQHSESFLKSNIPIFLAWKSRWFLKSKRSKSIHFFNIFGSEDFKPDIVQGVGSGATVTYAALQFAYYMGADPVIIVGVDHNFDRTGDSNVYEKRVGADVNHFDPNYFAGGTIWGIPNLNASEEVFLRAKQAFDKDNRKIYDATVGGKLQIFDKIDIDTAVGIANKVDNNQALLTSGGKCDE